MIALWIVQPAPVRLDLDRLAAAAQCGGQGADWWPLAPLYTDWPNLARAWYEFPPGGVLLGLPGDRVYCVELHACCVPELVRAARRRG